MSAKKFRLTVVTTTRENGYDWNIVECPECGEKIQQRHIEDEGRWFHEDFQEDVCPACDQAMKIGDGQDDEDGDEDNRITMPTINNYGYPDHGGDAPDAV
ncbi:hypothetical protein C5B90_13135 [Haloferax sp. Atlit-12N]|uniref:hypothetical protein n=1 Tax=Haloferax sp. Atlit-12N TaxID=2077203 RepID=UPI000E22CF4E|nr:hypothetical protein [Haloferax sp. Atlit-12N]RDZ64040.1 hypothetical protein C5B90_13135 [Haloferax sp. Atlit-12N]